MHKRFIYVPICLFVCLFVGIKPEKVYSASCVVREVNPLGVITHGKRHRQYIYTYISYIYIY